MKPIAEWKFHYYRLVLCFKSMTKINKNGFRFDFDSSACQECAALCCRGESGKIWVNHLEIENICKFLSINSIDLVQKYLYKINNRYSIKERLRLDDYECVFLTEGEQKSCSIYPVRPQQCQTFPFWDYYKRSKNQLLQDCPGVRFSCIF